MRTWPVGWINERLGEVRTIGWRRAARHRIAPHAAADHTIGVNVLPRPRPIGTALLFPATTALVSHRTDRSEYGVQMGAQTRLCAASWQSWVDGCDGGLQYLGRRPILPRGGGRAVARSFVERHEVRRVATPTA